MNRENFVAVCSLLSQAGFEGMERRLLQYMLLRPGTVSLQAKISYGEDMVRCSIHLERKGDEYVIAYYDAALIRLVTMPDHTINQVQLPELEKMMVKVNWNEEVTGEKFRLDDESTWAREKTIGKIIGDLARLSATDEGKLYADMLKVRYWSDTILEQLNGSLAAARSKLEVSQRFYMVGNEVIAVQQAYQFLINRWIEKKMSQEKRNRDRCTDSNVTDASAEGKVLKKKRISRSRKHSQ